MRAIIKLDRRVLTERITSPPNVYADIQYPPPRTANQLTLRCPHLEMQPAQHPLRRTRMVILHQWRYAPIGIPMRSGGLYKEAAMIPVDFRR
jgi:hypothetical protein